MPKDIVSTLVRLPYRPDRPLRLGVVANTAGTLPPEVASHLQGVDLILHAGDVGEMLAITRLEAIAPVIAIAGDQDRRTRLPRHRLLRIAGRTVAMTHGDTVRGLGRMVRDWLSEGDPGAEESAYSDLLQMFPPVDCVVFGHPATACRLHHGRTLILNPGAVQPTNGDQAVGASMGILELGRTVEGSVFNLGTPPPMAPTLAPVR
jgi:uncharacterized protein